MGANHAWAQHRRSHHVIVIAVVALCGCAPVPRYRTVAIAPPRTELIDPDAVGAPVGQRLNGNYNDLNTICAKRLKALEDEYASVSGRTATWRTALLAVGGLAALGTAAYAVIDDDPDAKVVGTLGLVGTGSLSANFGFLTESDRLLQLDADAAKLQADLAAVRASAEQLEKAGSEWSRQPDAAECEGARKSCGDSCPAKNNECQNQCASERAECIARGEQARVAFDNAKTVFTGAFRNAYTNCLVSR
jgi:hypothetical protein